MATAKNTRMQAAPSPVVVELPKAVVTPGRRQIKLGDWIDFIDYTNGKSALDNAGLLGLFERVSNYSQADLLALSMAQFDLFIGHLAEKLQAVEEKN